MQQDLLLFQVVTNDHGVVPVGMECPQPLVLQYDHRVAGGHFGEHILQFGRKFVGQKAVAPRAGKHLHLQAALARRDIHLVGERIGSDGYAGRVQSHCERCRTALIVFLREERHRIQFHARRQARATLSAQGLGLRQADAAGQNAQHKNKARDYAGFG